MTQKTDWLAEELDKLRATRDEFRLQLHLGGIEARDLFERLEETWREVEAHLRSLRTATDGDRKRIADAARTLAREIRDGYRHLKSLR